MSGPGHGKRCAKRPPKGLVEVFLAFLYGGKSSNRMRTGNRTNEPTRDALALQLAVAYALSGAPTDERPTAAAWGEWLRLFRWSHFATLTSKNPIAAHQAWPPFLRWIRRV